MSVPFAFVPRKVARPAKTQGHSLSSSAKPPIPAPTHNVEPPLNSRDKGKAKATEAPNTNRSEEDHAILVLLALSDYTIWLDSDFRRALEQSLDKDAQDAGFIPLSYLLRRSRSRLPSRQSRGPPESGVVRALRSYAADFLEVRMLVSAPSSSVWDPQGNATHPSQREVGGYEVRRKDWHSMLEHPTRSFGRDQWEKRTVYLENIPLQYRTVPGIARFTSSLLGSSSIMHIQNIVLPPHHLDKPGDTPKCKGFALVTLSHTEDRDALLAEWPWKRSWAVGARGGKDKDSAYKVEQEKGREVEQTVEFREAVKFGLRCLTKERWDRLNEEYVAYGQRLLNELVESDEDTMAISDAQLELEPGGNEDPRVAQETDVPPVQPSHHAPSRPITTISSPYPLDCLVFVRNVHPDTNKTTLRSLLSVPFQGDSAKGSKQTEGIDYVDFSKGMDSCFLRLSTPEHTHIMTEHFLINPTTQFQGLDDKGRTPGPTDKTIIVEVVQGRKEELYWEKVPEKVRRQAVQKAVCAQSSKEEAANDQVPPFETSDNSKNRKKRKRDK
ncbi:hypothetical protein SERLA73DRAFT_104689 [Serpula lacrymans var. lacrymans S7.3]|uniref:XRRM domain-containing protein n=2 Tax=Serpula lacrymans var. lacrymans TaxID=341189 RepID=F8PQU7_SERL3|nr:uncharacterized protein SERLADRAFT_367593 [Serpula lacrymans var. lacrymans S7.9]EGO02291.1 hypothetical protein SERLA73DRAFT_104689 [Serpula lacrymans var. lacrymans S7.3]EGO28033.1 hypothetical protein SERLADRAFT_367593 [Serpula lacrymans var. lacrymans S7.9]